MVKSTVELNERLLNEAAWAGLAAWALVLVDEIVKVAPRTLEWLPKHTLDRKDWKAPKWSRPGVRPVQIFGHWYEWVTGNLKKSISHIIVGMKAYVGTSDVWDAQKYAAALEYGTSRIRARKYLRGTIDNPEVKRKVFEAFKTAFYQYLSQYD